MSGHTEGSKGLDEAGQAEIEGRSGTAGEVKTAADAPPAGPHAARALTNAEATPGAGSLPSATPDGEADAGTG